MNVWTRERLPGWIGSETTGRAASEATSDRCLSGLESGNARSTLWVTHIPGWVAQNRYRKIGAQSADGREQEPDQRKRPWSSELVCLEKGLFVNRRNLRQLLARTPLYRLVKASPILSSLPGGFHQFSAPARQYNHTEVARFA